MTAMLNKYYLYYFTSDSNLNDVVHKSSHGQKYGFEEETICYL